MRAAITLASIAALCSLVPTFAEVRPVNMPEGLAGNAQLNPLPAEVLAFPEFTEHYQAKITGGNYEIWTEERLQRWSNAQGLSVTGDTPAAGLKYGRAAVIAAPGLTFRLRRPVTEKGSEFANGWTLNLDIAALRPRTGSAGPLPYNNLLECDVIIDDVKFRTIRQGAMAVAESPVRIAIPHIRNSEGYVTVKLRMANHPRNFFFLYDAWLSR